MALWNLGRARLSLLSRGRARPELLHADQPIATGLEEVARPDSTPLFKEVARTEETAPESAVTSFVLHLDFSATGNTSGMRLAGWSGQESDCVWTTGQRSKLEIPLGKIDDPLRLEIDLEPSRAPPHIRGQMVTISIDDRPLGWAWIVKSTRLEINIPHDWLTAGRPEATSVTVTFDHPGYVKLDWLGPSREDRLLALRFFSAWLTNAPREAAPPLRPTAERISLQPMPTAVQPIDRTAISYCFDGINQAGGELTQGWHTTDNGLTWSVAREAHLRLPAPNASGTWGLRLAVTPLIVQDLVPRQRLSVVIDGLLLGQFRIVNETILMIPLPPGLLVGRANLPITFLLPDAMPLRAFANSDPNHMVGILLDWIRLEPVPDHLCATAALRGDDLAEPPIIASSARFPALPADELHAAIGAELDLSAEDLMRGFESLGDNCGFGLAQRKAGAEILALLRFANTPLAALQRGLDDKFAAAARAEEVELHLNRDESLEYMLRIPRYGIRWHTMVEETDAPAETVGPEQKVKLAFLRRKWLEGVRSGRKIYTISRAEPKKVALPMPGFNPPDRPRSGGPIFQAAPLWDPPLAYEVAPPPLYLAEALAVLVELNRHGSNTLLFFVLSSTQHPAGSVDLIAPGLMRGYLDSFVILGSEERANDLDWQRVAANAIILQRSLNGPLMGNADAKVSGPAKLAKSTQVA